ncbi:MAG: acetyltransferase [Coprobacillus cateniformis]|uniref:acetyltransferase n=1 Tax=Longibaculum muris TaxID=1796628 RepID=UPI003AB6AD8E|nr:acetyltransferase [Coprobacillus cateniformis]
MKKLVIIGASGHGKVIADIAVKNGYEDVIFLDDDETVKECAGFPVKGKTYEANKFDGDKVVAIGNAVIREKLSKDIKCIILIHPDAVISRRVEIGEGTVIMAGAVVNSDAKIGKGCIINTGSSVDHDSVIGDFCHVSVGAHVAGTCHIGDKTWIGAGATVSNNVNICSGCMIGAGAVVIKNIEEVGTYIGCPVMRI